MNSKVALNRTYYSSLKIQNERKAWQVEVERAVLHPGMPVRLTVNNTTKCGMRCRMCDCKEGGETMEFRKFKSIAEQAFPYAKELRTSTKGEPLDTPCLEDVVGLLGTYGVLLNVTTNGMMLDWKISTLLIPDRKSVV